MKRTKIVYPTGHPYIPYINSAGGGGGASISTAKILKSGQTVSYRTGDDGDLEAGRTVDFYTLAENNPFSNTNRFTAIDGTQTYTSNIVLDWSTFNGSKVLGWYKILQTASGWNSAIDNSLAFSTGGFTSGWRLPNIREYFDIMLFDSTTGYRINYSPFGFTSSTLWCSTSVNASVAYYLNTVSTTPIYAAAIATSVPYLIVREFTVSGTTIT